jgi:pyruvate, orthophosphate dikinase
MTYVYDFAFPHDHPPMHLRSLLGGKGANLAEMTSVLRLPVPPGFTITTDAYREYKANGLTSEINHAILNAVGRLEHMTNKRLGDHNDPLLVSVRSGAEISMPGMMDTVLNLGLNDESVRGLANQTNDENFAYETYCRFISMYSRIVLGVNGYIFTAKLEKARIELGVRSNSPLETETMLDLVKSYKKIVSELTRKPFPQSPHDQLTGAIKAVFQSWESPRAIVYRQREGLPHDSGTAVNVQSMVFGNRGENSGTGVAFTRDPSTGAREPYGDFLTNAQGEDVVAGIRMTESLADLRQKFPANYVQLEEIFDQLEAHFRDMCDIEFTIEEGRLWMLQTRVGERTGRAAIRMAVEMTQTSDLGISRNQAVLRVKQSHLTQTLYPQFSTPYPVADAIGLGASPGAAVGKCYFNSDAAIAAKTNGEAVILVRRDTSPDDIHGIVAADGVLTAKGGLVSHAAVVARGWGKPAVVGLSSMTVFERSAIIWGRTIEEGDWISIDGNNGTVVFGRVPMENAESPVELTTLLEWADSIRKGHFSVRANADNAEDALVARNNGAEGIGLVRTEHMFLRKERLPIVRRMILATESDGQKLALEELGLAQRLDFVSILRVMDGLPVTIRLLDPPIHEFLPPMHELSAKEARGELSEEEAKLLGAAQSLFEVNPMMGTRGFRLAVVRPGLYEMQVRSLINAVVQRLNDGGSPLVEIMIPFVISEGEMRTARTWVENAVADAAPNLDMSMPEIKIGAMIETPRAAVVANQIARYADFFSFGTNDLTQMTFAFSRDDVESRLMSHYLEQGLLDRNPFGTIDVDGVGTLMRTAMRLAKESNPNLTFGVCGEHGGDPESIDWFISIGMNYVSCSPYRILGARLAAAHSILTRSHELPIELKHIESD